MAAFKLLALALRPPVRLRLLVRAPMLLARRVGWLLRAGTPGETGLALCDSSPFCAPVGLGDAV